MPTKEKKITKKTRIIQKNVPGDFTSKELLFIVPSTAFSIFSFLIIEALISDYISDYTGKLITQNVYSIFNYVLFYFAVTLFVVFLASMILTKMPLDVVLISTSLSFMLTIIFMSLISYVSIHFSYVNFFQTVSIYDQIFNFYIWNTYFIVYILNGYTPLYFFMMYTMYLVFTLLIAKFIKVKKGI